MRMMNVKPTLPNPSRTVKSLRAGVRLSILFLAMVSSVEAAGPKGGDPNSLKPEVLGAKAFLEELLIRRYSQELGTRLEKGFYTVGAELGLAENPKPAEPKPATKPEDGPPNDLLLGTLDPEELIKRYATDADGAQKAQSFLKDYKIRSVSVSVGVKEELGPNAKTETEKWLTARVQGEFGKIGKGVVSIVTVPIVPPKKEIPPTPKAPWDRLDQFQQLAGQIALAMAILLGAIFFALLNKKKSENNGTTKTLGDESKPAAAAGAPAAIGAASNEGDAFELAQKKQKLEEEEIAAREAQVFTAKVNEILPGLTGKLERVVQSWCQAGGEDGRLKVACLSEAVGRALGKLPIPADAIPEVSRVFSTMHTLSFVEKRDALKKIYWDLLTAMNLGTEAFDKPFDYLGGLNVGVVQQALLEQNPRLKTVVALFMPSKLREDYVRAQSKETKLALINSAVGLSSVPAEELKSFDQVLKSRTLGTPTGTSSVPLEMSLGKLVSALSPLDEIQLLSEAAATNPDAFDAYKRSSPSLAFLGDWKDDKLARLFSKLTPDELVAYLRVMPALADRFLKLCPPMTSELTADELRRPDTLPESESNRILGAFTQRLMDMVVRNEISMYDVFPEDLRNAA